LTKNVKRFARRSALTLKFKGQCHIWWLKISNFEAPKTKDFKDVVEVFGLWRIKKSLMM